MFERSGGGQVQRLPQLADELPRVQRIEQVDVAWGAIQNPERQWTIAEDAGRRLMRIDAVAERSGAPRLSAGNGVRP